MHDIMEGVNIARLHEFLLAELALVLDIVEINVAFVDISGVT